MAKKSLSYDLHWPETLALFLLVIGFLVAVTFRNFFFSFLTAFLSGFLAGRMFFFKRFKQPILPFVLIILGFFLGYLSGSIWVSRLGVMLFFVGGFVLSYQLHLHKILGIFKSKRFIK